MGFVRLTFLALCAVPLCAVAQSSSAPQSYAALEARVKKLEQSLSQLQNGYLRHVVQTMHTSLIVDPSSQGFGYLDTSDSGAKFAISVGKVESFADGVSVTLQVAPLFSASYTGLTLKMEYGSRTPEPGPKDTAENFLKWNDSLKRIERSVTQTVRPGVWTPVEVRLPGIKQEDFGYLSLSIDAPTIGPAT